MTTSAVELPAAEESAGSTSSVTRVRALIAWAWDWVRVALLITGRSVATLVMVARLGLKWSSWAEGTGIAKRHAVHKRRRTTDVNGNRRKESYTVHQLRGVPRYRCWQVTQHGVTLRMKVPKGADRSALVPAMGPLRHSARAQSASVREIPGKPGFLAVDVLRRDPLGKVALVPRGIDRDKFLVSQDEHGQRRSLDFEACPHWLFVGETGSGKSSWVNALASAMAATDDIMCMIDLKWGLEAQALGNRWSRVATEPDQATALLDQVLYLAERRAAILARLMCQNVIDLEKRYKVHLRRVRVFVDEVGELSGSDDALDKMTSIAQRARALGINLVVSGQRFGSDQGKKVTTIRGQLSGRVACHVADDETAKMALPGLDPDTRGQLLSLDRAGLALVKQGGNPTLQRPTHRAMPTLRRTGDAHAHHALDLPAVADDDTNRTADLTPRLDPIGA